MMPTISHVAEAAGVSIKTVSRVINESESVAPATRKRVLEAIKALNYYPNTGARHLASRKTASVGVVIPLPAASVFHHQFFFSVLAAAAEVLNDGGYELVLFTRRAASPFIDLVMQRRVDGLILMSVPQGDPRIRQLVKAGCPFVLTCRPDMPGSPLDRQAFSVDADHEGGMSQAVDHLAALGHRHFALINGPKQLVASVLHERGVRNNLREKGLPEPIVADAEFSVEDGMATGERVLQQDRRVTAVVCADDNLAIGVMEAAREKELRVPDDLSVAGFDDSPLSAYVAPPLTTVRQPAEEKGRHAAITLLKLLAGHGSPEPITLPTELIVRKSTGSVGSS